MLSSLLVVVIFSQRSQTYLSRASNSASASTDQTENNIFDFVSPTGLYQLLFDKRQWVYGVEPDKNFGSKAVFILQSDYGAARVDIIEGESTKDLESLKNEIVQKSPGTPITSQSAEFLGLPAYAITYTETVLGQEISYSQTVVKNGNTFLVIEERVSQFTDAQPLVDNLLQSLVLKGQQSTQVQGVSDNLATVELVDLVRPSIANIVYVYCLQVNNLQPSISGLSKPQYTFCSSGKGSGFVVAEEGIVATNGHVAKVYSEEALVNNFLNPVNKEFSSGIIRGIFLSQGQNPSTEQVENFYRQIQSNPQYLDRMLGEVFKLIQNKVISAQVTEEKYYVNVGSDPIKVDYQKLNKGDINGGVIPSATTYTAQLIGVNYPNRYSSEAVLNGNYKRSADVALLEITNANDALFPAVELGDITGLREGSDIIIAGYPTLVEGQEDPRAAISYKTSTKPTITKGIISSVKEDSAGKVVLQTDASIDHGTSGGPAFNLLGQVIGLATFMVESKSGNFNFLREVGELKTLMQQNNIDNNQGELTISWRNGLNSFRQRRFGEAIEYFEQVKEKSSAHPTVQEFIARSQEATKKGESVEGIGGLFKGEWSNALLIIFGSLSVVSFMLAGFLFLLPLFLKSQQMGVSTNPIANLK